MGNKNKIRIQATIPSQHTNVPSIPTTQLESQDRTVSFSFADFMCKSIRNDRFNNMFKRFSEYGKFSVLFLKKLSDFSSMSVQELKSGGRSTRCHLIEGENLELLKDILCEVGLSKNKVEQIEEFYQLTISTANGRFMGYFLGNVFYVLLIDPYHLLYPNLMKSVNQDLCNSYDPWEELLM